jgi:hypothetical protein
MAVVPPRAALDLSDILRPRTGISAGCQFAIEASTARPDMGLAGLPVNFGPG